MRVLLHACCGPCLLEPLDALARESEVTVCYANPNIAPPEEYERRRDTLLTYLADSDVEVIELPYDPRLWVEATQGLEDDQPRRCRACYRLRVGLVAEEAARGGFDAVATTLTVSPWQDQVAIAEEGAAACAAHGVRFMPTNYRERYPEATRRSRELGMYRQNYCGCLPSKAEADADRDRRRAERTAGR